VKQIEHKYVVVKIDESQLITLLGTHAHFKGNYPILRARFVEGRDGTAQGRLILCDRGESWKHDRYATWFQNCESLSSPYEIQGNYFDTLEEAEKDLEWRWSCLH
jgi:hypothetical protein